MVLHQMLNAFRIFDVLAAESVESARCSLAKCEGIDLAICDLHLEGLSGIELIRELATKREAQALQLRLHVGDIFAGPAAGMHALFHGGVFGGHAERVPPHRVQHFVAAHPLVAGQHVAHGVIAHVADMDAPRRIGEHLQHVALRLGAVAVGLEALRCFPGMLPAPVGLRRVKTVFAHGSYRPRGVSRRWPTAAIRVPWSG